MGITLEEFKEHLELIYEDQKKIEESCKTMVENNPFIEDGQGVSAAWLAGIVHHELLFLKQ